MVGDRIKQVREEKGLKLKAFSELLSTSPGFLSEVENGRKKPGYDLLISLKRIFGVDLNWLLSEEGNNVVAEPEPVYSIPIPAKQRIIAAIENMDEDTQRDVLKYAEEKKLLADFLAQSQTKVNK